MFSAVEYRAIDYVCEASTRHRLVMSLLMLPLPIQLSSSFYPDLGQLQETDYRTPWIRAQSRAKSGGSECGNSSVDLMEELRSEQALERFAPCVPGSPEDEQQKLIGHEKLSGLVEKRESFTCYGDEDLLLPQEVIVGDPLQQFRQQLPSFQSLVQRLKTLPVSDPLLHHSRELLSNQIFSHLSLYEAVDESSSANLPFGEEFEKESCLSSESLTLPLLIETSTTQGGDLILIKSLQQSLNVTPELVEHQSSVLDIIRKGTPAHSLDSFSAPGFDSHSAVSRNPISPLLCRSYVEMEADVPLSPLGHPDLPELALSTNHLSTDQISPVMKQALLSDSSRENMEKAVWISEKYPHCMAGFLLAGPQTCGPLLSGQSLPELLSLLGVVRESSEQVTGNTFLPHSPVQLPLTEDMTVEKTPAPELVPSATEQFTSMSVAEIDELLNDSAENDVQTGPAVVSDESVRSRASATAVPIHTHTPKSVKFVLLENTQNQHTVSENRPNSQDLGISKIAESTSNRATGLPSNTSQTALGGILEAPKPLEEFQVTAAKQTQDSPLVPVIATTTTTTGRPVEQSALKEEEKVPDLTMSKSSSGVGQRNLSVGTPREELDPLSAFMMLRSLQRNRVAQKPQQTPHVMTAADQDSVEKRKLRRDVSDEHTATGTNQTSRKVAERAISKTIYVQPTEAEKDAYWKLEDFALPSLIRARDLGFSALDGEGLNSLTPEHTRFCLKQQAKLLSTNQGKESDCNDVALLHILVTVKELLLRCDLDTAADYLTKAQATCMMGGLKELLRWFQVLQYLSSRSKEPRVRVLRLQEETSAALQTNVHSKILVVTAQESTRTRLVLELKQVTGNSVVPLPPKEGESKVDRGQVLDSLCRSRCMVVCNQHIGADFPWRGFRVVLEFDCSCQTPISNICVENNIGYVRFCTAAPTTAAAAATDSTSSPLAYLDGVPFLLCVTEGLPKRSGLLQLLESTYNMSVLERSHSQSLQLLGATHQYDVLAVDARTVILLQELSELELEQSSERVVLRLSALSLQFSCCWVLLHCTNQHSSLLCGDVFGQLVLIYSALVLFGLKSEDLDIKVLLVHDVADIAQCVYQICLHTLLSSERDVQSWLERDWFSVLPTEEERCLLCFPCVNSIVAQIMLRKAPSLHWLLEASLSELEDAYPEFPHKVCKLFSDITAVHRLGSDPSPTQHETTATQPHLPHPYLRSQPLLDSAPSHTSARPGITHSTPAGWFGGRNQEPWREEANHNESDSGQFSGPQQWTMAESFLPPPNPHDLHPTLVPFSLPTSEMTHPSNVAKPSAERKRPAGGGVGTGTHTDVYTVFPQYKRSKLLFERIPGRTDGQTRLRFF